MGKVLGLQWDMRHDISIVDHPYNFGQSGFDKHGQLLISKARTSEGMQLANRLVFHLYFQGACHGQCCSQAGSNHQNLFSFVQFLQRIYPCVNLLADGQVGNIESFVNFAIFASFIPHLIKREIFDPIFGINCSSKHYHDLVKASTVAHICHDGGYFVLQVDEVLEFFDTLTSLA